MPDHFYAHTYVFQQFFRYFFLILALHRQGEGKLSRTMIFGTKNDAISDILGRGKLHFGGLVESMK